MFGGYVCLIGAGPGHSGWITRQGLAYLRRADVVFYDHLVAAALLLETKPDCRRIAMGKQGGGPAVAQATIHQALINEARSGNFVVRLQGGDPFLFGRGGEEAKALVAAGVPYLVVPGISASLSVPASAGIPVTQRHVAAGVVIRTGHRAEPAAVEEPLTQVVLMSLTRLPEITADLLRQGVPAPTPAAVISKGSTPFQTELVGTVATIAAVVAAASPPAPALLVVGAAVGLAQELQWRSNLPLAGRRILWTRPVSENETPLLEELELLGAELVRLPLFWVRPVSDALAPARLAKLAACDWIVFTSQNAVRIFFQGLLAAGYDWRYLHACRIAVVGAKTGAALRERGRNPDLIGSEGHSKGLLQQLLENLQPREQVALCQAEQALPYLADGLTAAGVAFTRLSLYDLETPDYPAELVGKVFQERYGLVVLTAPVAVRNYFRLLQSHAIQIAANPLFACLGAETVAELQRVGHPAWLVPDRPTVAALVRSILQQWGVDTDVSDHPFAPVAADAATSGITG